jgi:predicted glycosyltransferase
MKKNIFVGLILITALVSTAAVSCSDSKVTKNNIKEKSKELYTDAKDEACKMVNGKLECAYKNMVNETKDLKDKMVDKVEDLKKTDEKNK